MKLAGAGVCRVNKTNRDSSVIFIVFNKNCSKTSLGCEAIARLVSVLYAKKAGHTGAGFGRTTAG